MPSSPVDSMPNVNFGMYGVPQTGVIQGTPVGSVNTPQSGAYAVPFGTHPGRNFVPIGVRNLGMDPNQRTSGQPGFLPTGNIALGSTDVKITIQKPRSQKARNWIDSGKENSIAQL